MNNKILFPFIALCVIWGSTWYFIKISLFRSQIMIFDTFELFLVFLIHSGFLINPLRPKQISKLSKKLMIKIKD